METCENCRFGVEDEDYGLMCNNPDSDIYWDYPGEGEICSVWEAKDDSI